MSHSLKSVQATRVDLQKAMNHYSESRHLGKKEMCPAGAKYLNVDEFGRPLGNNKEAFLEYKDAACSHLYTTTRKIMNENLTRPVINIPYSFSNNSR